MPRRRRRLGEVLVERGVIDGQQLESALAEQLLVEPGQPRRRLGRVVVELGYATERQIAESMADLLGLDVVDLSATAVQPDVVRLLPRAVAQRVLALPIARTEKGLLVAAADPTNVLALDDVRLYTRAPELTVVIATESQVRDQLTRAWSLTEDSSDVATMFESIEEEDDAGDESDDFAPTVRLVNVVLADAVRAGASDIHVEPQAGDLRIRYRVDGLLRDVMTLPRNAAPSVLSRIKIISGLDIAERRLPQDGRARLQVDGHTVDTRVSTLPAVHGEKAVIRLLSRADTVPALTQIGLDDRQRDALLGSLVAPQGLILLTGPTGSGKTNTLYSAISQIRTADRNIVTLEDPVEIQMAGITQVQVHERAGLTFARGLRSVLRQDPDVVLVGEVRDTETAELALQAAMTGHLVLTTLHTNDAVSALTRLVDMGVEPFLVASSLAMVVAQRLVRRPCEACAAPYEPAPRTLLLLGLTPEDLIGANLRRGRGCVECGNTGYRGRTGVFEVLPVTAGLRSVLLRTPNEGAVAAAARAAGMTTLRASALAKARTGETTLEEVLRVTHIDAIGGTHCPSCDRVLAEDMIVCPWCTTPVHRGHCGGCTRPLEPEWRICPWCRTPAEPVAPAAAVEPPETPRLLVVDDDPSVRAYIATVLTGTVDVDGAGSAQEAQRLLGERPYDGAVIDHGLPDLSGTELVRLLRSEQATALLPLLMLTGSAEAGTEELVRRVGVDDFLRKPAEPALLEERVLALVARSSRIGHH